MTAFRDDFGRSVKVRIDDTEFDEFDVDFKTTHKLTAEPNTAEVKLYNLSDRMVTALRKSAIEIELSAGYSTPGRIFIGNVNYVDPRKTGPDFVTTVTAGESEAAYRKARCNQSFSAGAQLKRIVKELANQFEGVATGNLEDVGFTETVAGAFTANGQTASVLTQLLKGYGYAWTIAHNAHLYVKQGEVPAGRAVLIDETSGIVGSPELGEKKAETSDAASEPNAKPRRYVRARMLLNPLVVLGRALQFALPSVNGVFVVEEVTHTGSNYDNDFYTDVEAYAIT